MLTLSAFSDEISSSLDIQLEVLATESIEHLEFRGVWDKNVLRLTNDELETVKDVICQKGFRVSAIGSPIGKINIQDDFEAHLADFERAIHVAKLFGKPYIRIFSFFIPDGHRPQEHRDEVMMRMRELVRRAEDEGIVLLHENEKHIYGDSPERCLDILQTCQSPCLRMAFDPANFVQCGVRPMRQAYPLLERFIEYVHIKDACLADGQVVPPGEGDGEIPELLRQLKDCEYNGFLSIEPHLQSAGPLSGFSGPELFCVASQALKSLLSGIDLAWR